MGLRKFIRRTTRKVENFAHRATGRSNIGEAQPGEDKGPQFSEEARRQAAGAGTVGFTARTQNY